jgi:tetratricopeptide (TPR) repeat protein
VNKRLFIGIGVLGLAALSTWLWWSRNSAPPVADPRLSTSLIWRNVHPEVKYVGDDACAGCHAAIARSYREHPMGRSLSPVPSATPLERFDERAHNPFRAGALHYRIDNAAPHFIHVETIRDARDQVVAERSAEVHFAVGSGRRGRSYLINQEGQLSISPVTWYPQKGLWDLSPGYERNNLHFTRPVMPECLFCHANRVEPVEDAMNRYREPIFRGHAIGCERCHGPGELHVRLRRSGEEVAGSDVTIVNPRHLEHPLREAVCQQCHLQGEERVLRRGRDYFDFRPGLPLHLFYVDFVKPPQHQTDTKFVGSVEQMFASRCFEKSTGATKLGCISCHDPHALPKPETKVEFYRSRCLNCHAEQGCSLPAATRLKESPADNCVACHMPPTGSDVNHTTITDHRIPRRPEKAAAPARPTAWPRVADPLVLFHDDLIDREEPEPRERDLGIALMKLADRQPADRVGHLANVALPLLERAVSIDAKDAAAGDARADALWMQGKLEDALAAYQSVLAKAPKREVTLHRAAALALRLKRQDLAAEFARQSLAVNPSRWQSRFDLAAAGAMARDWPGAITECKEALKLNPAELSVRDLLMACYLKNGDRTAAQGELEIMLLLIPPENQQKLRSRFEALAR